MTRHRFAREMKKSGGVPGRIKETRYCLRVVVPTPLVVCAAGVRVVA